MESLRGRDEEMCLKWNHTPSLCVSRCSVMASLGEGPVLRLQWVPRCLRGSCPPEECELILPQQRPVAVFRGQGLVGQAAKFWDKV